MHTAAWQGHEEGSWRGVSKRGKKEGIFSLPRAELQGTLQGWTWFKTTGSCSQAVHCHVVGGCLCCGDQARKWILKGTRGHAEGCGKSGMLPGHSQVKRTRTRSPFLALAQPLNGLRSPSPLLPCCGHAGHSSLVAHPQHSEPDTCSRTSPRCSPIPRPTPVCPESPLEHLSSSGLGAPTLTCGA